MSEKEKQEEREWMDSEEKRMLAEGITPSKLWYAAKVLAGTITVANF